MSATSEVILLITPCDRVGDRDGSLPEIPSAPVYDAQRERWLPVVGAGGKYEVSDFGRVRRGARILIDRAHPRGYRVVDISIDGKALTRTVHRLVAEAFHGPAGRRQVNHKNGVKSENASANLEWVSARANTRHAIALGLHKATRGDRGRFVANPRPVDPRALGAAILDRAEATS